MRGKGMYRYPISIMLTESYIKGPAVPSELNEVFESDPKTFLDCIHYWTNKHPEKDAVVFTSTTGPRQAVSWRELYDKACRMANAYIKMGIKPGEVIAICTRPCPEWLYVVFGAMAAGITVVTIVLTYTDGSDVIALMEKLQTCALLVLDPGLKDSNWTILERLIDTLDTRGNVSSTKLPYLRNLVFISPPQGHTDVETVSNIMKDTLETGLLDINPDDIAILFQTSGSTGVPKLVAITENSIVNWGRHFGTNALYTEPVVYNNRLFSWNAGFPFGLMFGQTRVTMTGMCPEPVDKLKFMIDVLQTEGCTSTFMVPPMLFELTKHKNDLPSDWPLQVIITAGQPITKSVTRCLDKVCMRLCVVYGVTEFGPGAKLEVTSPDQFVDYSSGRPESGVEIKIVDDAGDIVPIGERGELYVRSKTMFSGYFNDPKKTAKVKLSDGWYKTDDYGRVNPDGYLFVEGRKSDIILSGGMNVTPIIYETVLKAHPGIESAVIVPVPDPEMYQVICACVIVKSGYDVTEDQLFEYMERKHNDEEKLFTALPKYYLFLDVYPEETSGKVSRKSLRRMAEDRFSKK